MNDMQRNSQESRKLTFSTEALGPEKWRDVVCGFYSGISLDWIQEQPRPAWLGLSRFADSQVMEIASARPVRVVSTPSPSWFQDTYNLALLAKGNCRSRHAGREEVWKAGDLMLFDSSQSFDIVHPANYHLLSWSLPRESVAKMIAAPDRSLGMRISGHSGIGAILADFVRALLIEARHLEPSEQSSMLTHLYGLIGLAVGASSEAHQSRRETQREVRRQQILSYVEARLTDPSLTAQQAAKDLKISQRWLHAVLERSGISFAAWVAQRRLEECRKILTNPAYDHLTIADIAFRSGFSNLATFNRRFRDYFEMAPRDVRYLAQRNVNRAE
ncbi:helix-turn-helix domain-containing protein [Bythopirellula goksoeyrii]|uniref:Transcriptional activator NphR n=1 Tax=Bythopirellula goksoeyrii TaxID=1400387 RepID=A0A5B9QL63_9BACT|nr:helix-turn-helix domain-containing protein [Bythopirellula goksoeyrii]QEG37796.1 Transcriptional activator NphR [Bythopirellula goksoeyrii]